MRAVDSGTASAQVATPSNTPANGTVAGGSSTNAVQLSQLKDIIASIAPAAAAHRRRLFNFLSAFRVVVKQKLR